MSENKQRCSVINREFTIQKVLNEIRLSYTVSGNGWSATERNAVGCPKEKECGRSCHLKFPQTTNEKVEEHA